MVGVGLAIVTGDVVLVVVVVDSLPLLLVFAPLHVCAKVRCLVFFVNTTIEFSILFWHTLLWFCMRRQIVGIWMICV